MKRLLRSLFGTRHRLPGYQSSELDGLPKVNIDSDDALHALLKEWRKRKIAEIAVDTEADSLHRYSEKLCLIQFADGRQVGLIDPLGIKDLSPLGKVLEKTPCWMHGADYDMTMFRREFGALPPKVWDTQIGARLLGVRKFGLADLVKHYFDVELSKTSQKADWGKRPLSEKMVDYAINDVRYLLPMGERIVKDLKERGRYDWFVESCNAARDKVLERDESREDPWRIQGSGKLDPRGLAILRAVWHWREEEAKAWDRPTFMVAANRILLEWVPQLTEGQKIELPKHYRTERRNRLFAAIEEARKLSEADCPQKPKNQRRRKSKTFERKLDALLATRIKVGEELDIDPSLIGPRSVLESIAAEEPDAEKGLLKWQRQCLGI